jgi:hypothetical protein
MNYANVNNYYEQLPCLVAIFTTNELERFYNTCKAKVCESELSKTFYFAVGSALAAHKEFNSMAFAQLEHEARVQGFLGPYEMHTLSEWKLRLMLACEAKRLEEEERKAFEV